MSELTRPLGGTAGMVAMLGTETPSQQVKRVRNILVLLLVGGHLLSASVVIALVAWVIPGPSIFEHDLRPVTFGVIPVFLLALAVAGTMVGTRQMMRLVAWYTEERPPDARDQEISLSLPWRLAKLQFALWVIGSVGITTLYGIITPQITPKIAIPSMLGGIMVCSIAYVLSEFFVRPIAAAAIAAGAPSRQRVGGVAGRSILSWVLGTAVPIGGLLLGGVFVLSGYDVSAKRLAVTVMVILAIVLLVGFLSILLTTYAIVDPIGTVRDAMRKVEQGDFDAEVVVFDGTELGELQSGFNRMAQGLRDRERMREVFGRHVGQDVAARALAEHPRLGGEERMVAVFFIDLIGSTGLAAQTDPVEVVSLLNRFFHVIVDEVDRHSGFVNKFVGDAALVIFGAPNGMDDAAGEALAAARTIMQRLDREVPECRAATGISYGRAVAGNVGAHERYEYTVIGDPVNEAARLSELAKTLPDRIVASSVAVNAASVEESRRWHLTEAVVLRGRLEETRLAVPTHGMGQPDNRSVHSDIAPDISSPEKPLQQSH